ncbi:hypothetical protein [Hydrogenophaga sp.]|uniref:hypothetical protein n=1 Tax=Hydrogenophaga sp. TaxID=1904254 RepID=UPI0026385A95|nr:hypothetical protein [Hydrogenophaga sp.]
MNDRLPQFAAPAASQSVLDRVLHTLGGRRFTHLSRSQAQPYLERMRSLLKADMDAGRPLHFCYDLGPGYHASVEADFTGLRFAPSLGELLALRQIHAFGREVAPVYAPGVRFSLVIDDLCAWVTNDVELIDTARYLKQFTALVGAVGMQDRVSVLAESALEDARVYRRAFERTPQLTKALAVSPAEQDNVSRFVGRACSTAQAADHLARYQRALVVSDHLLGAHLGGVRLTQRTTAQSLGFRCFPGSDVRLQSGEVDLLLASGAHPRPVLITHRHHALYRRWPVEMDALPPNWPLPTGSAQVAALAVC